MLNGIYIAVWITTAANIAFLAFIAVLRAQTQQQEVLRKAITEKWQAYFAIAVADEDAAPPPLPRNAREIVLRLWLHWQESLSGSARTRLNEVAAQSGLVKVAVRYAARETRRKRLLGIMACGILRSADIHILRPLLEDPDPVLSLVAARALMSHDSAESCRFVMLAAMRRDDWPPSRVIPLLRQTPESDLARAFGFDLSALRHTPSQLIRLLELAQALPASIASSLMRTALAQQPSAPVVAAALRLAVDPRDASLIRGYLADPEWVVRVRALGALAPIAEREDLPRFLAALTDREWWVRRSAAKAIAQLTFCTPAELTSMADSISDRFGRDALNQALAERRGR